MFQFLLQIFGIFHHGAELVEQEQPPVQPATHLPEDRRSGRGQPDQHRNGRHPRRQHYQTGCRDGDIGYAFQQQPDFIVWRGREREQRRLAEPVQRYGAVDVREKIHRHARPHAFFIAHQEHFFQFRQALAAHREDHLVHHVLAQDGVQIADRQYLVGCAQLDLRRSGGALAQEAAQADSILAGLLQPPRQTDRADASAHHHYVVGRGKLAPDDSHHPSRHQPEQEQQHPRIGREENQKEAAQIQPEDVFEDNQAQRAIPALPRRIAQNHPRIPYVQFLVDFQPESDGDPRRQRKSEDQRLAFHGQIEGALQM